MSRHIIFTVTNDLTYDQRMQRICGSLCLAGYRVTLVGRLLPASRQLTNAPYKQKRLRCFFNKGFLFYAEYNIRLFFYLLTAQCDAICSIDLDTIMAGLFAGKMKGVKRVFDAHEYFTEMKEVRSRPEVQRVWKAIEKFSVPQFRWGYTVSQGLVDAFKKEHNRDYELIRNLPVLREQPRKVSAEKFLVYQGAVNEARGFEYLVPAMQHINYPLVVCGDGNFMEQLQLLITKYGVVDKVVLKGMLLPEELREIAARATLGVGLAEKEGINQYHALPNKFLEYIHAGLPQVAMNFPEYQRINREYEVALLLDNLEPEAIASEINKLMADEAKLAQMSQAAMEAKNIYCWQEEEKKLLAFYQKLFS